MAEAAPGGGQVGAEELEELERRVAELEMVVGQHKLGGTLGDVISEVSALLDARLKQAGFEGGKEKQPTGVAGTCNFFEKCALVPPTPPAIALDLPWRTTCHPSCCPHLASPRAVPWGAGRGARRARACTTVLVSLTPSS
jgi:hypothetical protein|eukprot:COSAG01_NODE_506_length_16125_cov_5.130912_13_plen_140_part_00